MNLTLSVGIVREAYDGRERSSSSMYDLLFSLNSATSYFLFDFVWVRYGCNPC